MGATVVLLSDGGTVDESEESFFEVVLTVKGADVGDVVSFAVAVNVVLAFC